MELEPGVGLEAHQPYFPTIDVPYKQHDVTICFFVLFETLLFDHLSMIDEADELPLAQMDDALRHVQ